MTGSRAVGGDALFRPNGPWFLAYADDMTGLDRDGAGSGNWAILDIASVRWLHFQGRPISNALRSLVSR